MPINSDIPDFQVSTGTERLLGATFLGEECWNFAVFAPDAKQLTLCLYLPDTEEILAELPFPGRTGKIWHMQVDGIAPGTLYAYKASGDYQPDQGIIFDENRVLIDPYAKKLNRALNWNDRLYSSKSHYAIAKGVLDNQSFDWMDTKKPDVPRHKTVIYEAHIKGMTMRHPEVPAEIRGTYLGMCHPAIIQHLLELGITTVQLMPVASFIAESRLVSMKLTNYWGYNPINFFAPDPRYQVKDAVLEFKELVRTFHLYGIEVILDVVFNHTAEGGDNGTILSFRGLANRHYYLFENHGDITDYKKYCNYTGCGNTFNLGHPVAQKLVMDALRYWATEMQVDGFRFDLAVTLAREYKQFNPHASFFQIIRQDPVLSQLKLVAEPWDIGPMGYQLGHFPSEWSEMNDKCRDTFRAFWRGDRGVLPELATRLLGSRDIFQKHDKPASCSVNFVTYHDGFTLQDLVSYNHKHNWLNGEENRDGHNHNLSMNHGVEGPATAPNVLEKRYKHKRNLAATLLISQGIIHWLGGDELSHTQQGNNNAYCQDNEITWLNWQLDSYAKDFLLFVRQLMLFRRRYPCLQQISLLDDNYQLHGDKHFVYWYLPDGRQKQSNDWHDPERLSCIFQIFNDQNNVSMLFIFNASDKPLSVTLPEKPWRLLFDTSVNQGLFLPRKEQKQTQYTQAEHSLSVWR